MFFLDFLYLIHFHFQGDLYAEVNLLPFPKGRWETAASVLTAKCGSCTCAQSTHYFSVQREGNSWACRQACGFALSFAAKAASNPMPGWI